MNKSKVRATILSSALLLFSTPLMSCAGESSPATATPTPTSDSTATSVAPTKAAPEVTLRLLPPAPAQPAVGQQFTVTIAIIGASNLGAYQFTPRYDRAVLDLVSITDLGFLATTGREPTCSQAGVAPDPVTQYCVTPGAEPPGPSGDGNLALLQFKALAPGETQITLERAAATTPDSRDLPVAVEAVSVSVTVAPDKVTSWPLIRTASFRYTGCNSTRSRGSVPNRSL